MSQDIGEQIFRAVLAALDCDNAHDIETFGQSFLQNGKAWDMLGDQFPDAKPSQIRAAMMRAFETFQQHHTHHQH